MPLAWNQGFPTPQGGLAVSTGPVKAPDIHFSSSQFRKPHPRCEKTVSRTSLTENLYAWPCESISRERAGSIFSELDDNIITKFLISFRSTSSESTLFKSKFFINSVIIIPIDFKG